jgi:penicillin amidase
VPGVVIGHNGAIAWGMTTSYADVQDLYLEQVRGDTVLRGGKYEPLQLRTEEIRVRGEDQPRSLRIRSSRHGPLLSDVSEGLQRMGAQRGQSGRLGLRRRRQLGGLHPRPHDGRPVRLDRAQDFRQFRSALALLSAPLQNFVYATPREHRLPAGG